jgi:glycosyltransferase involved in cell wall biosynthesis
MIERKPLLYAVRSKNPIALEHRRNLLLFELSKTRKVAFLSDVRRSSLFPCVAEAFSNILVVDNALRLSYSRLYSRYPNFSSTVDAILLNRLLDKFGFREYVPWITTPEEPIRAVFTARQYIYDCIDPCFLPHCQLDHDLVESQLVRGAAVTFCTATALLEKVSLATRNAHLVNNAVDSRYLSRFEKRKSHSPEPRILTLVYLGTVDWRIDFSFLNNVAQTGHKLVIAGRINSENIQEIENLGRYSNVKVLGAVSDDYGIELLQNADVGLLPYLSCQMNDCINSLKMYLYMAAGLPVLSTSILESRLNKLVYVSQPDCSTVALRDLIDRCAVDHERYKLKTFAEENTWDIRATQVDNLLQKYGI